MPGNTRIEATPAIVEAAVAMLREQLPSDWSIQARPGGVAGSRGAPSLGIEFRAPGGVGVVPLLVQPSSLSPREAQITLSKEGGSVRPLLIVASWISPRTQEWLGTAGVDYLDLTGNVRLKLDQPALFISSQGAQRDPEPRPYGQARVRGPKAGRLIRKLIDARPPYGVRELAVAVELAPGYVSRLLDTLHREGLIERNPRGGVIHVHVARLIDRWAENYDVLRSNHATSFISRTGSGEALAHVASRVQGRQRVAVSGSFAAYRLAPVAAPAQLLVYCESVDQAAESLELLPASGGADVVLLRPFDEVVWDGVERIDGIDVVAPSQVAVDCLTGTGRMPAEGEAVIAWMERNESSWRRAGLARRNG